MSPFTARALALPILLVALQGLGGCGLVQPVAPWQKGALAKAAMGFERDRLEAGFAEHVYSSKEAAAGGAGVAAGGCGCN